MSYSFGAESLRQLNTANIDLQTLFNEVIKYHDCKVIEGYRDQKKQDEAFNSGKSKLKYPYGNHNANPSNAVDVYPYPIDMKDTKRFYYFAGIVLGIADMLKTQGKISHAIKWGGDWDCDNDLNDQTFNDLVHFEIMK